MPLASSPIRASSAARRSGVAKLPPSISRDQSTSASPRAAEITSSIAPRPPERARSSGSWPSGSSAKRRLLPGARCGSARSAARYAAFCPALSPSKQRIGSSAIFHNSASWFSVSAVPSGATVAGKARADHGDDVDIAFDHHQLGAVMGGLPRGREVVEIVALVKQRGFRRVQVFRRHVFFQRAAAERDHPAAQIGDRKHHAVAKAVIGHRDVFARNQKPASTMSSTEMPWAPRCSFSAKRSPGA